MKICINELGHMTNMAAMPIYSQTSVILTPIFRNHLIESDCQSRSFLLSFNVKKLPIFSNFDC